MAFMNFLTQGNPLPSSTSSLTTQQVPQYLSDYLYNLMSGAYSAAQQEYKPYEGPRIAGFTDPQQAAFQASQQAATAYQPQLQAAQQTAAQGAGLNTLTAAKPYFDQASQTLPSTIQNYMNPYQKNVIETMGSEAQRQLKEKILPAIGDQFTRAGQYGSSRQQEIAQRGVRDIASDLESNIGKQLAQGYTTAGTQAQADLQRLASVGQAAGTLVGSQEANAANLANIQAGIAQKQQALGLTGAAAQEAVGAQQQQLNQKNLDLAYQDFLTQTQYPEQQLGFLSNIVRGLPSGGGTTSQASTSVGNTYSASPLASLASAGLSAAALSNLMKGTG
jgi:hypothetical protein